MNGRSSSHEPYRRRYAKGLAALERADCWDIEMLLIAAGDILGIIAEYEQAAGEKCEQSLLVGAPAQSSGGKAGLGMWQSEETGGADLQQQMSVVDDDFLCHELARADDDCFAEGWNSGSILSYTQDGRSLCAELLFDVPGFDDLRTVARRRFFR